MSIKIGSMFNTRTEAFVKGRDLPSPFCEVASEITFRVKATKRGIVVESIKSPFDSFINLPNVLAELEKLLNEPTSIHFIGLYSQPNLDAADAWLVNEETQTEERVIYIPLIVYTMSGAAYNPASSHWCSERASAIEAIRSDLIKQQDRQGQADDAAFLLELSN